jgi:hypothetical protein
MVTKCDSFREDRAGSVCLMLGIRTANADRQPVVYASIVRVVVALNNSFAMSATATPLPAGTYSVGSAYECRLTRGELIAALATYEGERRQAFFRSTADGSIVCAACGLHLGTHPDRPAGAHRVVLPSSVDGVPSYEVLVVSTSAGPESVALIAGPNGARVVTRGEALLKKVLPYFLLGALAFMSVCWLWLLGFLVHKTSRAVNKKILPMSQVIFIRNRTGAVVLDA